MLSRLKDTIFSVALIVATVGWLWFLFKIVQYFFGN